MNKNMKLVQIVLHLLEAAKLLRDEDDEFRNVLLDKAQEYKDLVIIDEKLEGEIKDYERRIEQRM